jgi:phosphinothricin acetyltransferase
MAAETSYRWVMKPDPPVSAPATTESVEIVPAVEDDLPGIVEIFNYTAANSIANFYTRPVSVADRRGWFEQFSSTGCYRLFVARHGGQVAGYAGSQRYRELEAFSQTIEVSIALDAGCRGQGVGTALYRELFDSLAREPVHVALAGIAVPNEASVALHRKFGFTEVGTFCEYAVKDGQYISSLWMQRLMPRLATAP